MVSGILAGGLGGAGINIIIRAVDNYSKEFKKLDKGVKNQQSTFKKLTGALASTGIGYAALAGAAVGFGAAAVKSAMETERAMQQFNLALGETADIMLKDMRRASNGMISDFQLVQNANAALALGISKNQIPELLAVATARSKVFGRTASEAFNDIAIGIGRQSRMILDNLGIIINLDIAYSDYAESIGKTKDELTEFEKKAALTNAILEESANLVKANIFLQETHTEKLQRLNAAYENTKSSVGLFLLELIDELTLMNKVDEATKERIDSMTGIKGTYDQVARATIELGDAERDLTAELKASNEEATKLIDSLLNLKDITFQGERAGTLEIAQQKELIRVLELKNRGLGATKEDAVALEDAKWNLEQMRLEQEQFANQREIQQAENALRLEKDGELEATSFQSFLKNEQVKFDKLKEERVNQDNIRESIKLVQDANSNLLDVFSTAQIEKEKGYDEEEQSIDELIKKTEILTQKYIDAANARAGAGMTKNTPRTALSSLLSPFSAFTKPSMSFTSVGDAIIRPNGDIIKTHPNDTLFATQNPGGMGGGLTLIIEGNVYGTDPDEIAEALQDKINPKILT